LRSSCWGPRASHIVTDCVARPHAGTPAGAGHSRFNARRDMASRYSQTTSLRSSASSRLRSPICCDAITTLAARRLSCHSTGVGRVSSEIVNVEDGIALRGCESAKIHQIRVAARIYDGTKRAAKRSGWIAWRVPSQVRETIRHPLTIMIKSALQNSTARSQVESGHLCSSKRDISHQTLVGQY
jgi:hypothetical protein